VGAMRCVLTAAVVMGLTSTILADGMIVPVRPDIRVRGHWAVRYHHVSIRVRDQIARVSIDQEFVNTGSGAIEVEYFFPVPPEAALDSMTLIVDGKEYAAELLEADKARKIYEEIVRRKKDPALLEYAGFGLYKTRAFPLEPNKPVQVVVTYKNICRRDGQAVEVWYPLNTEKFSARPIDDVRLRVDIRGRSAVLSAYCPTHEVDIDRKDERHVVATYHAQNVLPTTDFQLFYKTGDEDVGATWFSYQPVAEKDGYFLLLLSPGPAKGKVKATPKDVVLVLDRSGSMGGGKLDQTREAARFILDNLNDEDQFNIIAYNDAVEAFFDETQTVTGDSLADARRQLENLSPGGGTNIHEALQAAMSQWPATYLGLRFQTLRPKYVIFLTDGLPTVGKTDEKTILADTSEANEVRARLFAFGVGYDVNVRLLDGLVEANRGRSEYVKPAEPIEAKVSAFYRKIKNPVMTDLSVELDGVRLRETYPREMPDLFDGDQIVLCGRYDRPDEDGAAGKLRGQLVLRGTYKGGERVFEYSVELARPGRRGGHAFIEKLWAMRRIGWLLDQIHFHGEDEEIVDEVIRLSRQYGIVTPYTSFLAKEEAELARPSALRRRFARLGRQLGEATGETGQRNAVNRAMLRRSANLARQQAGDASGPRMIGYAEQKAYEAGRDHVVRAVRLAGNQAIYRRKGDLWIASNAADLQPDKDADRIVTVRAFGEAYFDLLRRADREERIILASQQRGEELIVRLAGQAYRIR